MKNKWVLIILIFSFRLQVLANILLPQDIVKSSLKFYPEVTQSLLQLEQSKGELTQAQGEFDGKVSFNGNSREQGFYDGQIMVGRIEKPLSVLNAKVYGGYRVSEGLFPSYEGKNETLDGGETFIGGSLSLLRNSLIDTPRYNIKIAKENVYQAELQLDQMKIEIQSLALKAYWTWVIKGYELKVYENILELATQRASNLARRIKVGDLAKIYGTENLQYIKKREAQLKRSELEFAEASYYLSLFNRDLNGAPTQADRKQLPLLKMDSIKKADPVSLLYRKAIEKNLELKKLESQVIQAQAQVKLGNNDYLPQIDVGYEFSQDKGIGPANLGQQEGRVLLKVEVPFQYNKARGKKTQGRMKLSENETKIRFTKEKLKTYLQTLSAKINTTSEVAQITATQVELAKTLTSAEWKKFKRGSSDLILVNLREENLAETEVKNLENYLKYHYYQADLMQILMEFYL